MTKAGLTMMMKKKKENQKYAETVRQKEMFEWRNRYALHLCWAHPLGDV